MRGKHGSEGDYVMNRPLRGPQNPTPVDHATDTYDTIDWLVKNVPESNGRVGILGISYDGFLPLMALVHPHPALKVAVAMNPMVDGWMGDDWFHNGAFRELNLDYIYDQEATRKSEEKWWRGHRTNTTPSCRPSPPGRWPGGTGLSRSASGGRSLAHPSYDAFWRDQAVDRVLAAEPLTVPLMLVHSLWDQEDIYGATAVYRALKPKDADQRQGLPRPRPLVPRPGGRRRAARSAALKFDSDTSLHFRRDILRPFLDSYLKDGAPRPAWPP